MFVNVYTFLCGVLKLLLNDLCSQQRKFLWYLFVNFPLLHQSTALPRITVLGRPEGTEQFVDVDGTVIIYFQRFINFSASIITFVPDCVTLKLSLPSSYSIWQIKHLSNPMAFAEHPEAQRTDGLMIVRIEQALHFANTGLLKDSLRRYPACVVIHHCFCSQA